MPPAPAHTKQVPQRSLFRYPGGKSRLITHTRRWLRSGPPCLTLVEPFAGGAAIALTAVAENLAETAVLIELEPEVAHVWRMALTAPDALAERIASFPINEGVEGIGTTDDLSDPDRAARTLVLNRTRYNGIMAKRAGRATGTAGTRQRCWRRLEAIGAITDRINLVEGDGLKNLYPYAEDRRGQALRGSAISGAWRPPCTDRPESRTRRVPEAQRGEERFRHDLRGLRTNQRPRSERRVHSADGKPPNGTNRPQRELPITRRRVFR